MTRPETRSARPSPWRALCLAAAAAGLSTAAAAPVTAPADPADPAAVVPALSYRPTLTGYRPWAPPEPRSWREVNDTVARIGGWRVYLREAHAPDPTPSDAPAATPTPAGSPAAGAGQGHHGRHGGGGRP